MITLKQVFKESKYKYCIEKHWDFDNGTITDHEKKYYFFETLQDAYDFLEDITFDYVSKYNNSIMNFDEKYIHIKHYSHFNESDTYILKNIENNEERNSI